VALFHVSLVEVGAFASLNGPEVAGKCFVTDCNCNPLHIANKKEVAIQLQAVFQIQASSHFVVFTILQQHATTLPK